MATSSIVRFTTKQKKQSLNNNFFFQESSTTNFDLNFTTKRVLLHISAQKSSNQVFSSFLIETQVKYFFLL